MSDALENRLRAVFTALCAVFLIAFFVFGQNHALAYVSVLFGAIFPLREAWESIREKELDVHILMILAAIGAIIVGHPEDSAALLFLFSLSDALEHYAMGKTQSAIEGLIKLRPKNAELIQDNGEEVTVPVESLVPGQKIRVPGFATIPVDGVILQGNTSVNQASMTGESTPVPKSVGENVIGGTQNLDGTIVMKVLAASNESALEKIVELVKEAQENQGTGERISKWFGQKYTIFVFVVFALSYLIRVLLGMPNYDALYASITLLVALSPCALVISTPATTLSALSWAARKGILVRGGEFLEKIATIRNACFDKTGTLTTGKPQLVQVCVCTPDPSRGESCITESACWHGGETIEPAAAEALAFAAAMEQHSTHPIAEAVVRAAERFQLPFPELSNHRDLPGLGVSAEFNGVEVKVGQRKFFQDLNQDFSEHILKLESKGYTVAICQVGTTLTALALQDEPVPAAKNVIAEVNSLGIRTLMLSGDNPATAQAVAEKVGIKEVHAHLMPKDKTEIIEKLEGEGGTIMVGDGINDAPSLTRASVGIAMGGLGSDIALNAADIVLMNDKIERIPDTVRLGRRCVGIIRANLILSISVVIILTIFSFFGKLPLPIAVLGHEGSTVVVILNGLRMLGGPGRSKFQSA